MSLWCLVYILYVCILNVVRIALYTGENRHCGINVSVTHWCHCGICRRCFIVMNIGPDIPVCLYAEQMTQAIPSQALLSLVVKKIFFCLTFYDYSFSSFVGYFFPGIIIQLLMWMFLISACLSYLNWHKQAIWQLVRGNFKIWIHHSLKVCVLLPDIYRTYFSHDWLFG